MLDWDPLTSNPPGKRGATATALAPAPLRRGPAVSAPTPSASGAPAASHAGASAFGPSAARAPRAVLERTLGPTVFATAIGAGAIGLVLSVLTASVAAWIGFGISFVATVTATALMRSRTSGCGPEVGLVRAGLGTIWTAELATMLMLAAGASLRAGAFHAVAMLGALAVMSPALTRNAPHSRRVGLHWQPFAQRAVLGTAIAATASTVAAVMLPRLVLTARVLAALALASIGVMLAARWNQLGHRGVSGVALVLVLAAPIGAVGPVAGPCWWVSQGLLMGALAFFPAAFAHVAPASVDVRIAFRPVLARDPFFELDLQNSPLAQRFAGELAAETPIGRDHVLRVAELAVRSGEQAELAHERLRDLGLAALLHDIGKLAVPKAVLEKSGRLLPEEFELVKQHSAEGEAMLSQDRALKSAALIVRWHHERVDGRGYPDCLAGTQIPIEASIVSVCDAFDAMTTNRQYRKAMTTEAALAVLAEHAGSQWRADVVDIVNTLVRRGRVPQLREQQGLRLVSAVHEQSIDHVILLDGLPDEIRERLAPPSPTASVIADLVTVRSGSIAVDTAKRKLKKAPLSLAAQHWTAAAWGEYRIRDDADEF